MQFHIEGNKVRCVRERAGTAHRDNRAVVSFDAQLDEMPTHVAAKLRRGEQRQLSEWLEQRRALRERAADDSLIEALPDLLQRSGEVLAGRPRLSDELLSELRESVVLLSTTLENVDTHPRESEPPTPALSGDEALKVRLDVVRENL